MADALTASLRRDGDPDLDPAIGGTIEPDLACWQVADHADEEPTGHRSKPLGEPAVVIVSADRLRPEARRAGGRVVRPGKEQGLVVGSRRSKADLRAVGHPGLRATTLTNVPSRSSIAALG